MSKSGKRYSNQPGATHAVSEFDNPRNKPDMAKGPTPARKAVSAAASEVANNPPAILKKTAAKFGAKTSRKQRVAIILAKARRAGGAK